MKNLERLKKIKSWIKDVENELENAITEEEKPLDRTWMTTSLSKLKETKRYIEKAIKIKENREYYGKGNKQPKRLDR